MIEKSKKDLQMEIDLLRRELRTAREAAEITSDFVVRQFEQTESMLHRFQTANSERQAVLDAATQLSIITTDLEGTIQLFSKGASTLLGYRPSEMINKKNILVLHLPEELERYGREVSGIPGSHLRDMEVFDQFVKQKQSRAQEWVYVCKDGTHLPVSLSITSLYNPVGHAGGYLFTAMDLTLQKQMERELRESKELAESANASKGDFLAKMSHEIRTPMNGIIGLASLLQKTALNPKQHTYVEKLVGSANTLLRLINDILDFSKIDAGKMKIENVQFNLEDILGNIANVVGMQAEKKGLEFLFRIDPTVPVNLIGDPLRLGQVLMNLAGNAVKFTEKGEILLSVSLFEHKGNDLILKFSVKDSGIGLDREQLSHLFSAFSQADDSITRKYGGTGLGLAICKQLTELMGGKIWVESTPGVGTEFIFTTRLKQSQKGNAFIPKPVAGLSNLRALVVDDNETAREVLSSMLKSMKMKVDTAVDGESALSLMADANRSSEPYDVVLLDWIMPGIDGIETARRIKSDPDIAKIPAMLMVTANGREEAYVEAENVQLDGFLLKPVYASVLYNTLLDAVGVESISGPKTVKEDYQAVDLSEIEGAEILLVDDNSINQDVAAEFLQSVGMNVTIAANGWECLGALAKKGFDLVLMDIQMPGMDGLETTRRIRRDKQFSELPIIAMTAHAMKGDREKSLAAGMNDHLTKPIDQRELFRSLKKWIKRKTVDSRGGISIDREEVQDLDLPDLPGIDHAEAIRQLANNRRLFVKMLFQFRNNYSSLPTRLQELSAVGNWAEIQKQAHSVKGVAGYIGSNRLQKAAHNLEDALKNNRLGKKDDLLAAFIEALDGVLGPLSTLTDDLQQRPVKSRNPGLKAGYEVVAMLQELVEQLRRGESTAEDRFEQIRRALVGNGLDDHLQKIAELVDDIEFAKAADTAEKLITLLSHHGEA